MEGELVMAMCEALRRFENKISHVILELDERDITPLHYLILRDDKNILKSVCAMISDSLDVEQRNAILGITSEYNDKPGDRIMRSLVRLEAALLRPTSLSKSANTCWSIYLF